MKEWLQAVLDQIAEWLVRAKRWEFWIVLVAGLLSGLVIGSQIGPTQGLTTGWAGLVAGAILGAIAAIAFEWGSAAIDQVAAKRPLNKVLGPVARSVVTIYLAPFARPPNSELLRLDRALPFGEMPTVVGTELVVGLGDTIALSFIYATLLKSGKRYSDIVINHNADLERGKWGILDFGLFRPRSRAYL